MVGSLRTADAFPVMRLLFAGYMVGGGRHEIAPHHTIVCQISQLRGALLAQDVSLSNLACLLISRRPSQWCRRIFPFKS